MASPIWFKKQESSPGGVLYLPADCKLNALSNSESLSWYFVFDVSGSMSSPISGANMSRYQVAQRLLRKVLEDLKTQRRQDDKVTLVTFAGRASVVCKRVTPAEALTYVEHMPTPDGPTNISEANTMVHTLMAQEAKSRAVEVFFTDGDPTAGMRRMNDLKLQKAEYYRNLYQNKGHYPFLWTGAISSQANWRLVRELSLASPCALWSHIPDEELSQSFAAEVGLITSAAMHMRMIPVMKFDEQQSRLVKTEIMWLPEACNLYYTPKIFHLTQEDCAPTVILAPSLVRLLAIHAEVQNPNPSTNYEALFDEVQNLHKTQDVAINESMELSLEFERRKITLLAILDDIVSKPMQTLPLVRQQSMFRTALSGCNIVRQTSRQYAATFQSAS